MAQAVMDWLNKFFSNRDRRFYIIMTIVAVLVVWFSVNWYNRGVVSVKVAPIVRGQIQQVVTAAGTVKAPVFDLSSKMGGRLIAVLVTEGDRVSKGQLLAQFDNYEQAKNDFDRTEKLFHDGYASKQNLDVARNVLDSARIISPSRGTVAKVNNRVGETVLPGAVAITVVDRDSSWIEAQVDEIDVSHVRMGEKANITSDNYPDKNFPATITWVSPLAELRKVGGRIKADEESYVFPIKLKFDSEHDELLINMSVNADVVTSVESNVVIVPREALVSKNDHQAVYLTKWGSAKEQKIEIGIRSYTSVEAVSGVKEGDLVIISNLDKIKDKGRINVEH